MRFGAGLKSSLTLVVCLGLMALGRSVLAQGLSDFTRNMQQNCVRNAAGACDLRVIPIPRSQSGGTGGTTTGNYGGGAGMMPMAIPIAPGSAAPDSAYTGVAGRVSSLRQGLDLSDPTPAPQIPAAPAMPADVGPQAANCNGYPQTRPGIVQCFRDGSRETARLAQECRTNAEGLASLQPGTAVGTRDPYPYSQRQSFIDCADLYQRGAQAQDCASRQIAAGMQVNPAVADCRRRYGIN